MTKPIVVSYSELDAFRQCPHKHSLAYRQGWTSDHTAPALSRGQLWHEVMAIHYTALRDAWGDLKRRQAIADYLFASTGFRSMEECELVAWMYDNYEDKWGDDADWEIVAIEDQRLCRLPTPAGRGSRFYLRMRVDLVVRERFKIVGGQQVKSPNGKLWLVDHKSGKDLPTDKELDIDDQFSLYTWGCRQIGTPVFGSIFNAARTYRHVDPRPIDELFDRKRLYRTDRELDTVAHEAYLTARTAYNYAVDDAPRAPDSDRCRWRCSFTEACLMGRKSGPELEATMLESTGFARLDEDERLKLRGYVEPMMP